MKRFILRICFLILILTLQSNLLHAQSTTFTYQGSLKDGANPANGNYDFVFNLFSTPTGGTAITPSVTLLNRSVVNGIFTVDVDFGIGSVNFNGSNRYVEINIRPAGNGAYTTLSPRQLWTSVPYSVRSLDANNAASLGGIPANQYVTTNSISGSFILNTATQQSANFNISGNGIVGGNIGIGTSSPTYKLDVTDRIRIKQRPGSVGNLNTAGLWLFQNTPNIERAFIGMADDNTVGFYGNNGSQWGLTMNTGSGNVGIGTLPSAYRLNVTDPGNIGLRVLTNSPGGTIASFGGYGNFVVDTVSTVGGRFSILENGNVGIGTNAPVSKLEVNGTVHSSSGGFKFPDGSMLTTANTNSAYVTGRDGPVTITPGMTVLQLDLPPGNYLLTFLISVSNPQSLEARRFQCRLSNDPGGSFQVVDLEPRRDGAISISSIASLQSQTVVTAECSTYNWGSTNTSDVYLFQARFNAVKLSGNVVFQ